MNPQSFKDLQEELLKQDEILRAEIELVMPRTGGFNAKPYNIELDMHEPPRPTEVKSLWRWWLRTIYSACECGEKNYKELEKKVSEILGSTEESSKFSIVITQIERKELEKTIKEKLEKIPRLKLLTMKKEKEREKEELGIPARVTARVILYKNRSGTEWIGEKELKLAAASFILSLLLGGLGSITSRGFGSILIKKIDTTDRNIKDLVKKHVEPILGVGSPRHSQTKDLSKDRDEVVNYIENFIEETIKLACSESIEKCRDQNKLPKVPTLLPGKYFKIDVIKCPNLKKELDILKAIGCACLKSKWKKKPQQRGGSLHTWILGLPRGIKKEKSGYVIKRDNKEDLGRRGSAIRFKYFERGEREKEKLVIVYGFVSEDWPLKDLYHLSKTKQGTKQETQVSLLEIRKPNGDVKKIAYHDYDAFIKEVFDTALEFVKKILIEECRSVYRECERNKRRQGEWRKS